MWLAVPFSFFFRDQRARVFPIDGWEVVVREVEEVEDVEGRSFEKWRKPLQLSSLLPFSLLSFSKKKP